MQIISVNTAKVEPIATKTGRTGIFKRPQAGPVDVTADGLAGDAIVDTDHHGGIDQAVYVYGQLDYDWWTSELGRAVEPGTFGENVTLSGLASADVGIGDRLVAGDVVMEVTSPRIPCLTFAARMDDSGFPKRFTKARRPGWYCRVIAPGALQAGTEVAHVRYDGDRVTLLEMFDAYGKRDLDKDLVHRFLAAPVHYKLAAEMREQL